MESRERRFCTIIYGVNTPNECWKNLPKNPKAFTGVYAGQMSHLKTCFQINLNLYCAVDARSQSVIPVFTSQNRFHNTMYLNLHRLHLSYVTDFRKYAKKYQCPKCEHLFKSHWGWRCHLVGNCSKMMRQIHPGGLFKKICLSL